MNQLAITKNGDGIQFCLQGFSCHSNLALHTGDFSPRGTTSLSLLRPRHNRLYCTTITDQWNSPRIYCLFYTLVWQVFIRTKSSLVASMERSGKMLWGNGEFLIKCKRRFESWRKYCLVFKRYLYFLCASCLDKESTFSNSDLTKLTQCPLATKEVIFSDDFMLL